MRIRALFATRKSDTVRYPELLAAWDENDIDLNPEGAEEDFQKALAAMGDDLDEYRYVDILAPQTAIERAFERTSVSANVEIHPS